MYIKFIKEHPVGIAKGVIVDAKESFAKKMIKENYAEKSDSESCNTFKKKHYDNVEKDSAKKLVEIAARKKKNQEKRDILGEKRTMDNQKEIRKLDKEILNDEKQERKAKKDIDDAKKQKDARDEKETETKKKNK